MRTFKACLLTLICCSCFMSCTDKFREVPASRFIGTWKLTGRDMLEDMQVQIVEVDGSLVGRIVQMNNNKFVRLFVDSNAVWVSGIERTSNFQFRLKENKIGKELFSVYDLPTSTEFDVQFIDENTFALAKEKSNPLASDIIYKRIR
jgi:hypothetical protein